MFHRKVHPENSVSTGKSNKLQKDYPKNIMNEEGDGDANRVLPAGEDIVIYPQSVVSKKGTGPCKSHFYPPQATLIASDSDGNKEHWIKTDADCMYLLTIFTFLQLTKYKTNLIYTTMSSEGDV